MLDEERSLPNLPESPPAPELGEKLRLGVGQSEQLARLRKLVGWLRVDDLRLGVGKQALREPHFPTSLGAGRAQVGKAMHHHDVLRTEPSRELERLLEPLADSEVRKDPPRLVDDDD